MLFIDLTTRRTTRKELDEKQVNAFLGGRGLGISLLYSNLKKGIDPQDESNPLIFTTGPLQGYNFPFSSKTMLTTKSYQTGLCAYSVASTKMGHFLRRSGIDVLFITGKSSNWVYLSIINGEVEFRDAVSLKGYPAGKTQQKMINEVGIRGAEAVVIGPAGENQVGIAAVVTGGDKLRTFARCGVGAVMGGKKLKGLVVYGDGNVSLVNRHNYKEAYNFVRKVLKEKNDWVTKMRLFGSSADMLTLNYLGLLPTRNWKYGTFADVENISPHSSLLSKWKVAPCSLYCPAPCGHISKVEDGKFKGAKCEGPEYETLYALGSNLCISDPEFIVAANQLCDELGLDTMSTGAVIGFAMECYEKGIINNEVSKIELIFGKTERLLELIEDIAYKRNLGEILSGGVKAAAYHFGKESEAFAVHSKGLEFGGYECRGSFGQALQYALSNRGGCHHDIGAPCRNEIANNTRFDIQGKGKLLLVAAGSRIIYDCSILCSFVRSTLGYEVICKAVSAVTGAEISISELQLIAARVLNLERIFNVREGITRTDDHLPNRLVSEAMPDGPTKGRTVPLNDLLNDFYITAGWDPKNGVPTDQTLVRLGIKDFIDKFN
jgi:aldehyde:ferredoxin oxidoreductase